MPTKRIQITGKVQGVFFRESARKEATRSGLTGWVRNLEDGSVEVRVSGPETALNSFIAWCRKGPILARVTEVKTEDVPDEQFEEFVVLR